MATGFLIRDGLPSDIPACLALDHTYATDYAWQMNITENQGDWQINFTRQRLPRTLDLIHTPSEERLRHALPRQQGFLVAVSKEQNDLMGYVALYNDMVHDIAWIQDIVVARPFRRHHIGTRLLNVARAWAKEQERSRMMLESRTQNYPAIAFCQQNGLKFCGFNDHYFINQDIAVFFCQSLR